MRLLAGLAVAGSLLGSGCRDLHEKEQGLCSLIPQTCPQSKQLRGICCRTPGGVPEYFDNFCIACQAGCISFVYKAVDDGSCEEDDL